jgi:hypothetical protein
MHLSRGVAWIGGAAMLATWFIAAAGQGGSRSTPAVIADESRHLTETERAAVEIQQQADRLRSRLVVAPAPSEARRNPFVFRTREVQSARDVSTTPESAAAEPAAAAAPLPEPDPFTLSGVATDENPEGPVRTAVLSGLGDVFLVKAGDIVASRYEIVAVGADAVELKDVTSGRTFRIGLR